VVSLNFPHFVIFIDMDRMIITEEEKQRIKGLYEQGKPQSGTTKTNGITIIPLTDDIKFVRNSNPSISAGEKMGNVNTQLGQGHFIVFNTRNGELDFLNTVVGNTDSSITMSVNEPGFRKDGTMFNNINDRLVIDVVSLICGGFYGSVTVDGVINVLNAIRVLQQTQRPLLRNNIITNFNNIFNSIYRISAMNGQQFLSSFPTNLEKNRWGGSGNDLKTVYSSAIKYFPGNIRG